MMFTLALSEIYGIFFFIFREVAKHQSGPVQDWPVDKTYSFRILGRTGLQMEFNDFMVVSSGSIRLSLKYY